MVTVKIKEVIKTINEIAKTSILPSRILISQVVEILSVSIIGQIKNTDKMFKTILRERTKKKSLANPLNASDLVTSDEYSVTNKKVTYFYFTTIKFNGVY